MTRSQLWPLLTSLAVLMIAGCGGYRPVRWPSRALWIPAEEPAPSLELLTFNPVEALLRVDHEGLVVAGDVLQAKQVKEWCGVNLIGRGIQPIRLAIQNHQDQPYLFRKADIRGYVPAVRAASALAPNPLIIVIDHVRWLTCLVPGSVFTAIIEPASGLDFPGIEEAATRPPRHQTNALKAGLITQEIPDTLIQPHGEAAGLLFVQPPRLGGHLSVKLLNAQTNQPVVLELPMPPPLYAFAREYPQPSDAVWTIAQKSAAAINSWKVLSADKTSGVMVVKGRFAWLPWTTVKQLTLTIRPLTNASTHTMVTVESVIRGKPTTVRMDEHSATIEQFFEELDAVLMPKSAPKGEMDRAIGLPSSSQETHDQAGHERPTPTSSSTSQGE